MPMFGAESGGSALDNVAHIIQLALTPVFLLSGIATLLSVFSTRLGRVADRVQAVSDALDGADATERQFLLAQLAHLRRRSVTLEVAVVVSGIGGAATGGAVLVMFVGALRDEAAASILFALFGLAIVCAIGAISAFTFEMLLLALASGQRLRRVGARLLRAMQMKSWGRIKVLTMAARRSMRSATR
jgi:hypothetical protein